MIEPPLYCIGPDIYLSVAYAAQNNKTFFQIEIESLLLYYPNAKLMLNNKANSSWYLSFFEELIQGIHFFTKSDWLFPYMIQLGDNFLKKYEQLESNQVDVLSNIYTLIIGYLENLIDENSNNNDYKVLKKEYEKRIDDIYDINYSFKQTEE